MYTNLEVMYPILLKCCSIAENNFWSTVFNDLSRGITPYGTYISKDYLCCSYKNKEFSYKIDENLEPTEVYKDISNLFVTKLKLSSLDEKIVQRCAFNKMGSNIKNKNTNWSSIRKKNSKDLLIEKFVLDTQIEYKLTLNQTRYLLKIINYFIFIKSIDQKDILYEDNKIQEISGISFSENTVVIDDKLFEITVNEHQNLKNMENYMRNNWEKYLKDIHKLVQSLE